MAYAYNRSIEAGAAQAATLPAPMTATRSPERDSVTTRALRRYVLGVTVVGPAVALATAVTGVVTIERWDLLIGLGLTAAGALAVRMRFRSTHQTTIDVGTAAYVAMILILPWQLAGVAATLAMAGGDLLRHRSRIPDRLELGLNVGQTALAVTAGAGVYAAVRAATGGGPTWSDDLGALAGIGLASTAVLAINAGLVAVAAGLQLGTPPWRLWWQSLRAHVLAHADLTALGGVGALLAADHPLALPLLAVPAIQVHRSLRGSVRLRQDTHAALAALVDVVELRDPSTAGHSRRVASLARALALRLGLTQEEADAVESAGRVHDLGKLALDPVILTKDGGLTEADWAQVRQHPVQGAAVIARFGAFGPGYRLVRHHHEAWDGTGYPDRLAGEAIPFGARILAVADTFDALTRGRGYRPAKPAAAARAILRNGAGRQWDPRVVEALAGHLDDIDGGAEHGMGR